MNPYHFAMSDEGASTFTVNFGRPAALFPLNAVALLPHSPFMLHVFEPRYRQLVRDVLDESRQIAMATFEGDAWRTTYHGRPPLRPVVCLGQIMRCEAIEDGRYLIILQGLCRARIVRELPPDGDKLYRRAMLEPLGTTGMMGADADADADESPGRDDEARLRPFRRRLSSAMAHDRLGDLKDAPDLLRLLGDEQIPTDVLMEILGHRYMSDQERRYRLLASEDPVERAALVSGELLAIQDLLRRAAPQRAVEAPKGVSWN
jgi:Lon protease-like protein